MSGSGLEVADVFRRFGEAYLAAHGGGLLPSHRRAIRDLQACRTPALGGHKFSCDHCGGEVFAWHSCRNRACPKCHTTQTERWAAKLRAQMLPVPYFHTVVTIDSELRPIFRANQRDCYGLLQQASGQAIVELARDPRYCGGTVGVLQVLHTWTQLLLHHPHAHHLVTGGGISADGSHWLPVVRPDFLFPVRALSRLVRGKFLGLLREKRPDLRLPEAVWKRDWVVYCRPCGMGEQGIVDYLARYVFRVALSNWRLLGMDEENVAFRYTDRESGERQCCEVTGQEFIRRFLQHVLPAGYHKVRYYGLWHPGKREALDRVRVTLQLTAAGAGTEDEAVRPAPAAAAEPVEKGVREGAPCPICHQGRLRHVEQIPPRMPGAP